MQERKIFDEKFIRLDTRRLCELTSAADALAMKPLVDLTSRALARLIEGKTPEQVCPPPWLSQVLPATQMQHGCQYAQANSHPQQYHLRLILEDSGPAPSINGFQAARAWGDSPL